MDALISVLNVTIALAALVVAVLVGRDQLKPIAPRVFAVVASITIGILVLGIGFIIHPLIASVVENGLPGAQRRLAEILQANPLIIIQGGLFPGAVTTSVAVGGTTLSHKMVRACVAAIVTLIIWDIVYLILVPGGTMGWFLFALASNVVGGIIGGSIIALAVDKIFKLFEQQSPLP